MTELTEKQKKIIALALHGLYVRQGPLIFDNVMDAAKAFGIESILEEYATDWIEYSTKAKQ